MSHPQAHFWKLRRHETLGRIILPALAGISLATVAMAAPASAEVLPAEPPVTLPADATLARLIDESLSVRPELARARAVARAEHERIPQAGALPDPMVQIGIQNDGFTSLEIGRMDTSFVSLMASQTFPWPGKRGLRGEIASLAAEQVDKGVARVRLSTEADVRRAYLGLLLVRARLALLDQIEALWQKSSGVARARYETGNGAQSDLLRAQLEQGRLKQRRLAQRAEERGLIQVLNRLRNHALDDAIATSAQLRSLPAIAQLATAFSAEHALARSPELAQARLAVTRMDRSVALAEKGTYSDLVVGTGIMVRGSLPPMWLATVGGTLPVYAASKQNRVVAESRALANAAQNDSAAIEQLLRLRSEERRTAFTALVETVAIYEQGLLVQSAATAESTLSQYTVGKVTFASVLEATAGFIADQDGYLEAVVAAHRLLVAEAEISLLPTAMSAGGALGSPAMPGAGPSSMESASGSVGGPAAGTGVPAPGGGSSSGM